MWLCTKVYVQSGTDSASVYTLLLNNKKQENLLTLGHLALLMLAKRKKGIDLTHLACIEHVAQVLQCAQDMNTNDALGAQSSRFVVENQELAVNGISLCVGNDSKILLGKAAILIENCSLNTDTSVIHTESVHQGVPVHITSVLSTNAAKSNNVFHFLGSKDTKCVDVRLLELGRRCQSSVIMQPVLSRFLQRTLYSTVHKASFSNLGLELENTKQKTMPLYNVVQSVSGQYICYSIFI